MGVTGKFSWSSSHRPEGMPFLSLKRSMALKPMVIGLSGVPGGEVGGLSGSRGSASGCATMRAKLSA